MRMLIIKKNTSAEALGAQLLKPDAAAPAVLERLRALNPHADLDRLTPGTVLVLPDLPDIATADLDPSSPADGFKEFSRDIAAAMKSGQARLRDHLTQRAREDRDVGAVLDSDAIRKRMTDDSQLRGQVEQAQRRIAADAKQAKEVLARVEAIESEASAELEKLRQLLG